MGLFFVFCQQVERRAQAALALEETLRQTVHQCHKLEEIVDAPQSLLGCRMVGDFAERFGGQFLSAPPQRGRSSSFPST